MTQSQYHRFNSLKILVHADRLKAIAEGGVPFPIDWHIYPSNFCNHSCSWCMFRQNGEQFEHPAMLSRNLLLRACADAVRTGARLVHFSGGGEPLLNPYVLEALEYLERQDISVALSTNGSLLNPEIASRVDFIRVSLNAGTKSQYDQTNHSSKGKSDWNKVLTNIKQCAPQKKKDLGLSFVVDQDNWMDIEPFCVAAIECNADFVHIRPAFWYDAERNQEIRTLMPDILRVCDAVRQSYSDKLSIFAVTEKFDGYWSPRTYDRCRATLTGACLTATGDFSVCQDRTDLRFGAEYSLGKSFEEIWLSQEHLDLVRKLESPGCLDQCPRCVWNKRNEIIEEVFINDSLRLDLV